ncbi:hypothetical protein [Natrinema sp. J7-1]|uniref:hypothetical protein n=1 Tax=Natrinema sp. J7-1 TaxID=1172566 RepID=UPI0018CA4212|nr:hypothetical protein [Natrinema sp. J7-1]
MAILHFDELRPLPDGAFVRVDSRLSRVLRLQYVLEEHAKNVDIDFIERGGVLGEWIYLAVERFCKRLSVVFDHRSPFVVLLELSVPYFSGITPFDSRHPDEVVDMRILRMPLQPSVERFDRLKYSK